MAATRETAVAVVEQSTVDAVVEWTLDEFPVEQFNRLIPTQTLAIPTDLLRPVVQVVQLNPDPERGGDVYTSKDMPSGHGAPTKVALRKFATAAGISIVDERRTDDGTDPDVIEVTCWAEMVLPTGQRQRAIGQKRIDLNAQSWSSPAHRAKYKSFFLEHVASRAENRAIRGLLSLRGSYPLEVYRKPFAVVSFAPNMAHPEVRARILDAMAPAVGQLYGPSSSGAPQLGPGPAVQDVTPAPEDDDVEEGQARDQAPAQTGAPAEPDWMSAAPAPKPGDLATLLRDSAESSNLQGEATAAQLEKLRPILQPIGGAAVTATITALWGEDAVRRLTAAQAQALINGAGRSGFADDFRAIAGGAS